MVHIVSLKKNKHSLDSIKTNLSIVPFQTVIAIFCIISGIFGLAGLGLNNDQFASAIGFKLAIAFNIGYILAGTGMIVGIGWARKDIELFGLTTIITSLLVRSTAIGWSTGLNKIVITSYVFNALLIGACLVRAYTILHYKVIIQKVLDKDLLHVK